MGILRTSSPRDRISSYPMRTAPRRQEEEPGDTEALQQRAGSLNIKRLLLIKENQVAQVKKFSTFLCMGRCKCLGSLKSFIWLISALWGQYLALTSRVPQGSLQGVGTVWWLLSSGYSFLPGFPQGSPAHLHSGCNCWWLWHLYWYDRKYYCQYFSIVQLKYV